VRKIFNEVIVERKLPNLGKKRDLKVEIVQQFSDHPTSTACPL